MNNIIQETLKLGKRNPGVSGRAMWDQFVKENRLTDNVIGAWVPVTAREIEIIKQANQIPPGPYWLQKHFESQPHRIRMEKPASMRRIAQIAFNWTSAGNSEHSFVIKRYINLF